MPSPWEILGLDDGHRDQRSIKRAYAKLLKQHRPDQDPDGFRRIHEAYQWALRMAEEGDAHPARPEQSGPSGNVPLAITSEQVGADVRSEPVPSPDQGLSSSSPTGDATLPSSSGLVDGTSNPPPANATEASAVIPPSSKVVEPQIRLAPIATNPPVETAWDRALGDLDSAAGQPSGSLRDQAVIAALRALAQLVSQRQGSTEVLVVLLDRYVASGRASWRTVFTDDDLIAELRSGKSDLTANTLKGCFEASDWDRLTQFAKRWLQVGDIDQVDASDFHGLTRVLAIWLALVEYDLARKLVDNLPVRGLRVADEELDQLMAMGFDMRHLPATTRRYLCDIIRGIDDRTEAAVIERGRALAGLLNVPPASVLGRVLRERFPGYFAAAQPKRQMEIPFNLLSAALAVASIVLFWLVCWITVLIDVPALIGFVIIAMMFVLGFALPKLYRRLLPGYLGSVQPWITRHFGPLDVPCFWSLLWLWFGVGIPLLGVLGSVFPDVVMYTLMISWLLSPPLLLRVIRRARILMGLWMGDNQVWPRLASRIRSAWSSLEEPGTRALTFRGCLRFAGCWLAATPAMIGAVTLVVGVASCPSWWPKELVGQVGVWMVASGPLFIAMAVIHALLAEWWETGRRPWWKPVQVLAWCGWIPALPWMASMSAVWMGMAPDPAKPNVALLALIIAMVLPFLVRLRTRRDAARVHGSPPAG